MRIPGTTFTDEGNPVKASIEVKEYNTGPCVICGTVTYWACSDCAIDTGNTVYVCGKTKCRDIHEETCTMKGV